MGDYNPHHTEWAPKLREVLADDQVHGMGELMEACGADEIMDVTHVLHELQAAGEVTYHGYGLWQRKEAV